MGVDPEPLALQVVCCTMGAAGAPGFDTVVVTVFFRSRMPVVLSVVQYAVPPERLISPVFAKRRAAPEVWPIIVLAPAPVITLSFAIKTKLPLLYEIFSFVSESLPTTALHESGSGVLGFVRHSPSQSTLTRFGSAPIASGE